MPTLDFQALNSNPHAKVFLAHPTAGTYEGFVQEEFSIGGQAQYSNPFSAGMGDKGVMANAMGSEISAATGGLVDMPTISLKTKEQTRHQWTNSDRPSIPINITLVRYSMSQPSVTSIAKNITKTVYPKGTGLLQPPGGYEASSGSGTWAIKVGEYFKADKLLLLTFNTSYSQQKVSDGSPLFCNLSLTFEPYMVINEDDYLGYFTV